MTILLRLRRDVLAHWHAVASELGAILPGTSRNYRASWEDPAGAAATLVSQKYPTEVANGHTGIRIPIVPLVAAADDESPFYWMSWYEQWRPDERLTSKKLQFSSSSVVIYKGLQDVPKMQLFRAEWAGVQRVENGRDIFLGSGAAHPHWHFDAYQSYAEHLAQSVESRAPAEEQGYVEFGDNQIKDYAVRLPDPSELNWTGIHLAISARWSEKAWPGPEGPHDVHASGPESPEALRRWLTSCVRYVQAEINKT
jgi:hypothetical protein